MRIKLLGLHSQPVVTAKIEKLGRYARTKGALDDLALLTLKTPFDIPPAEFAAPLRHAGKRYSALGFPDNDPQGRSVTGLMHAANAAGLVQMDGNSALFVQGGFSGAPVWCPDVSSFVGIVVRELSDAGIAWCIPSRILCNFYSDLPVKFRIPPADRPQIHDRTEDDPNLQLFGKASNNGSRALEGTAIWNERDEYYEVKVTFRRLKGSAPLRGKYVTFITYPDFLEDDEDAYELFSEIKNGTAWTEIYPEDSLFAIAAIADGGDTALTLDLTIVEREAAAQYRRGRRQH